MREILLAWPAFCSLRSSERAVRLSDLRMTMQLTAAAITGGITQCLRIAGIAQAFNVAIANGGAWPFHNMHLHAGLAHGGFVEYHRSAVLLYEQIYTQLPAARDGWLELSDAPGFGIEPDWAAIRTLAKRPLSRGTGKA